MKQITNIERLSKPGVFYASIAALLLVILVLLLAMAYATYKIDYNWRWYRLPQYFVYKADITIQAEEDGEIDSIVAKGKQAEIRFETVAGDTKTFTVPVGSYDVDEGDMISVGDVIAEYKGGWKPGVLLQGLWVTLYVSVFSTIIGITLGVIGGLMRVADNPALKWFAITYVELIRGSPLLVQIFIWYFVIGTTINQLLQQAGYSSVKSVVWGIVALSVFTGAYVIEMVRAGIQSIHFGQTEAARSCGMTYFQSMRHVILPQALRRILPPLAGQFINLIKDSSLIGIIAVRELLRATREVIIVNLSPFELFITCAVLYLTMTFTLSMFVQYLERRMATA